MNSLEPMFKNGVNVSALMETIQAISSNNEVACFQFRAANRWLGGDHNRTTIEGFSGACEEHRHIMGPFVLDNAEPPILLGEGAAPNPVEYILHALAGCLTTSMIYHAAARNITITDISSRIEGDLDLRGFLGMSDDVRPGFSVIRVKIDAKSEATAEELKMLTQFSPVYDIISRSVAVEVEIDTH